MINADKYLLALYERLKARKMYKEFVSYFPCVNGNHEYFEEDTGYRAEFCWRTGISTDWCENCQKAEPLRIEVQRTKTIMLQERKNLHRRIQRRVDKDAGP